MSSAVTEFTWKTIFRPTAGGGKRERSQKNRRCYTYNGCKLIDFWFLGREGRKKITPSENSSVVVDVCDARARTQIVSNSSPVPSDPSPIGKAVGRTRRKPLRILTGVSLRLGRKRTGLEFPPQETERKDTTTSCIICLPKNRIYAFSSLTLLHAISIGTADFECCVMCLFREIAVIALLFFTTMRSFRDHLAQQNWSVRSVGRSVSLPSNENH